jgi:SMC interacting uncharacterized protein involved in chromosome segregation
MNNRQLTQQMELDQERPTLMMHLNQKKRKINPEIASIIVSFMSIKQDIQERGGTQELLLDEYIKENRLD